jgi:anti-sigma regulatory factor (Ser/Thr protein kinase)
MSEERPMTLIVPGQLRYRPMAIRALLEACKLMGCRGPDGYAAGAIDLSDDFAAEVVSAFSELFNNIVLHAYGGEGGGDIQITLVPYPDRLSIELRDDGAPFDPAAVPAPPLESLPNHGMGIHIVRSFLDEVAYEPGPPNVWRLVKRASYRQRG